MTRNNTKAQLFSSDRARWQAVIERDAQADGAFVYGVATTGIYCRPACSSRLPNRENVRFFDTSRDAERAGFRPCKRCNPDSAQGQNPHVERVIATCRLIEEADESPLLEDLARAAGLSPSHFHRVFKQIVGVTPKQYFWQTRTDEVRTNLQQDATITEAIYNSGFNSSSQFYDRAADMLGMKPSQFRNGGQGTRIRFAMTESYLGWVLVAATERGICAIDLDDDPALLKERLLERFPYAEFENDSDFWQWLDQVVAFLESPHEGFNLPLDIQGTAFQRRVWETLQDIPAGSTASYAEIAGQMGRPKAARAVAQACASNKIAVAIPCHRVVRSDGTLAGYRWGLERKRLLLEREREEREHKYTT